jgi:hypothetical protein
MRYLILLVLINTAYANDIIFPTITCIYPDNSNPHTYSDVIVDQDIMFKGYNKDEMQLKVCNELRFRKWVKIETAIKPSDVLKPDEV